MRRVTYPKDQLDEARRLWEDFGDEWQSWRDLAAKGPGILYPPNGTKWDSWEDAHPSQRALVYRAIDETPKLLRWAILGAKEPSWSAVIGRLLAGRDEMREQIPEEEVFEGPTPQQATYAIKSILTIIGDS